MCPRANTTARGQIPVPTSNLFSWQFYYITIIYLKYIIKFKRIVHLNKLCRYFSANLTIAWKPMQNVSQSNCRKAGLKIIKGYVIIKRTCDRFLKDIFIYEFIQTKFINILPHLLTSFVGKWKQILLNLVIMH